jgi:large subunit ribosomal protein L30
MPKLKVTLIKSPVSHTKRTIGTMHALGLRRIGQSVVINDTPELLGMTRAIRFLLKTEPVDGAEATATKSAAKPAARHKEASNE